MIKFSLITLCLAMSNTVMAINAYVISYDIDSDNAIVDTLQGFGIDAQLGVSASIWDGSQIDLDDIDVVLISDRTPSNPILPIMPLNGEQALVDFVNNGGGLITSGRIRSSNYPLLAPLFPGSYYGTASGQSGAIYQEATTNRVLNQDLPLFFGFSIQTSSGTRGINLLDPEPGATEFYTNNLGGIQPRPAGLVGWEYGEGRVLSFANMFTPIELEDDDLSILLRNAVTWTRGEVINDDLCIPIKAANSGFAIVCL